MPALVRRPGRQRDGLVVVARGRPFCAPQATAPQIRSAVRRFELERWGLGTRRALVGYHGERPLSRGEPGDGLATRRFSWIDEKELARSHGSALAARRRSPVGDAGGDAPLRIPRRSRRMAAVRSGVAPASW